MSRYRPLQRAVRQGDLSHTRCPKESDQDPTTAPRSPALKRKEGDLIVGPHHRSAIATLIERQTRYVKLVHLSAQDSATLRNGLVTTLEELPVALRQSLTWDQGTEMARHLEITTAIGTKIFFCDAASPRQRGSNENAYWYKMAGPEAPSTGVALVRAAG